MASFGLMQRIKLHWLRVSVAVSDRMDEAKLVTTLDRPERPFRSLPPPLPPTATALLPRRLITPAPPPPPLTALSSAALASAVMRAPSCKTTLVLGVVLCGTQKNG